MVEFLPCMGGFQQYVPHFPEPLPITLFGKSDVDRLGRLQIVGILDGDTARMFHVRGIPFYEEGTGSVIDWGDNITFESTDYVYNSADIACSRQSERIVIAWIVDPPGLQDPENIMMRMSGRRRGSLERASPCNKPSAELTLCLPMAAIGRSAMVILSGRRDFSILIDDEDNIHIVFTAAVSTILTRTVRQILHN
ncbi:MAG: hypothetical protein IPP40_13995 [bacterium]|nr:hypothetical protein [bacterium]